MKNILCFGDSNTYGYIPGSGKRYSVDIRWTSLLSRMLGTDFNVIEAGCNNRTFIAESLDGDKQTGYKYIHKYFSQNIDMIILALGINDVQKVYNLTLDEIERRIKDIIKIIRVNAHSEIILFSPPILSSKILDGHFSVLFDKTSVEKSKELPSMYLSVANKTDCHFFDVNNIISVSSVDGLHYESKEHKFLAESLYKMILDIL